eukprot:m.309911 g.309911  ORF g.309911 m.309911 type:complete len:619 (+) comp48548_c0_seq1:47-1903(+)
MAEILSKGVIQAIVQGKTPQNPVVQILNMKKIQSPGGNAQDRYRLIISDGDSTLNSMMATQLNSLILNDEVERFAVLRLTKYVSNEVSGRKIVIILGVDVLKKGKDVNCVLGNPAGDNTKSNSSSSSTTGENQFKQQQKQKQAHVPARTLLGSSSTPQKTPPSAEKKKSGIGFANQPHQSHSSPKSDRVFPIKSLNPYQTRWTIRARVTSKTSMKTWSNSRGDGQLFSVDLLDESDEIRATAFNEQAVKLFPLFEKGKVYLISRGQLRPANKRYTSIKNDYELTFSNDTTVELCSDFSGDLPEVQYDIVEIRKIEDVSKDSMIDVIGILKNVGDSVQITARSSGRQVTKRDLVLMDKTGSVTSTIWGEDANTFEGEAGVVIAVKGARVSDFGGRCLSVSSGGAIDLKPGIPEAMALREWYKLEGHAAESKSISGGLQDLRPAEFKVLSQIKGENLGHGDKPDYFSAKAMVVFFKKDNCLYKACPLPDSNYKVVEMGEGAYRCERLDRTFDSFKWRFVLQMHIADFTGEQWISCFNESAEAILHQSVDTVGQLKESDDMAYDQIFNDANFKLYNFRIRAKMESYNDEQRLKCSCVGLSPLNFKQETSNLIAEIKRLEAL